MADKAPLGILFIHGIGNAVQGETLIRFAEPIYHWLERWLKDKPGEAKSNLTSGENAGKVQVVKADLKPSGGAPAHAEWLVQVKQVDGEIKESKWLLAEAWWTESFIPASFWNTLIWAFQIGPSLIFLHFSVLAERVEQRDTYGSLIYLLTLILIPIYFLLSILLGILVQLLALLLVALSILPIKAVRSFVTSIQFAISNWIGDAYLLTKSPIQHAVMVNRVRAELEWMSERCEKIAVVAHSQGAAIGYEVLQEAARRAQQENQPGPVKRFVTFGSAVKLLKNVQVIRENNFYPVAFAILTNIILIGVALLWHYRYEWRDALVKFLNPGEGFFDPNYWSAVGIPVIIASILAIIYVLFREMRHLIALHEPVPGKDPLGSDQDFEWIDMYASHDPASNGPLSKPDRLPEFILPRKVHNQSNIVTDHSTYWANTDEFVTAVVSVIGKLTDLGLDTLTRQDAKFIRQTGLRRWWRTASLARERNLFIVSCLALFWTYQSRLVHLGNDLITWYTAFLNELPQINDILKLIPNVSASSLVKGGLGAVTVLVWPFLWYILTGMIRKWWEVIDLNRLFQRKAQPGAGVPVVLLILLEVILITATLLYMSPPALDGAKWIWQQVQGGQIVMTFIASFVLGYFIIFGAIAGYRSLPDEILGSYMWKNAFTFALINALIFALFFRTLSPNCIWIGLLAIPCTLLIDYVNNRRKPSRESVAGRPGLRSRSMFRFMRWSMKSTAEESYSGKQARSARTLFNQSKGFLLGVGALIFGLVPLLSTLWPWHACLICLALSYGLSELDGKKTRQTKVMAGLGIGLALLSVIPPLVKLYGILNPPA